MDFIDTIYRYAITYTALRYLETLLSTVKPRNTGPKSNGNPPKTNVKLQGYQSQLKNSIKLLRTNYGLFIKK